MPESEAPVDHPEAAPPPMRRWKIGQRLGEVFLIHFVAGDSRYARHLARVFRIAQTYRPTGLTIHPWTPTRS